MTETEAREVIKRPARFGDSQQIKADRFFSEVREVQESLNDRDFEVVAAAMKRWVWCLDFGQLVELENMIWGEQKSRRRSA